MMILRRTLPTIFAGLFALAGLGAGPCTAATQSGTRGGPTPPRLRFIDGAVSFWRTGAADWSTAQVNTALAAGDSLYAGDGANLEIQIGPQAFIRAGSATEVDLTSLSSDYMQIRITGGHAAFDLQNVPRGQTIEVDTPNGALTLGGPGYYRIDVEESKTAFSARRGGTATVVPATGETTNVADNEQTILDGTDTVQVTVNAAPAPDAWDRWNDDRTAQLGEAPRSAQYVPAEIAGADDLDRYGDWSEQPQYGHVWVPRGVGPNWAPYSTGRWVYDPYYQWTWVDDAPWGWAPYHYGRWVNFNGGWGWAPGPVVAAPVYSPALVAFFGAPGIGVSVGVGLPFVSWVALGFGEPIVPWWGQPGFVGRPYWGGWGGPRVVNNVVINNTKIVNVTNVTKYQNVNVRNAVMGVDRHQFGRGRMEHNQLDAQHVQRLQPLHGDLNVRPVGASLVPGEAHGQRPPDRLQARRVVATRPPQDAMSRLRARGVETAAPAQRPEPRIVQSHAPGNQGTRAQAGVGAQGPGAVGHQQPPPVPGGQRSGGADAGRSDLARHPQAPPQERAVPPPLPHAPARQAEQAIPQPPGHQQAAPQERAVPPPPPHAQARQPERAIPQPPGHQQAAPQERAVPPPPPHAQARQAEHAIPQPPSHQQAAPQEHAVSRPPSHPQAPPPEHAVQQQSRPQHAPSQEHAAPQPPSHPQAAPQERAVSRPPSHPQAPPPERAVQRQPRPQHAPSQERAAPQQPSRAHAAAVDGKAAAHEEPKQERQ